MKPWIGPAIACAFLAALHAAWPGDVVLGPDEQMYMIEARAHNAAGRLADASLMSVSGVRYPPLPMQMYQVLLVLAGNDVPTLISLQAVLVTGTTAAGLLWLTRSLGWSPWLAVLPLCGPFFWQYARSPWGNPPMAMPIGVALVAAWAAYLRTGGRAAFCLAAAAALALPLVHPMMLPLAVVFGAHALIAHRPAFRRNALPLLAIVAAVLVTNIGYARIVEWHNLGRRFGGPPLATSPYVPLRPLWAILFPWMGGELLSGYRFESIFAAEGPTLTLAPSRFVAVARDFSAIAFPLVWLGVISILWRAIARRRAATTDTAAVSLTPTTVEASPVELIGVLCLISIAFESALHLLARQDFYPHYHLQTWPAAIVCLWAGLRVLRRAKLDVPVGVALAAALLTVTGWAIVRAGNAADGQVNPTFWTP